MNNFENKVLNAIARHLDTGNRAEFYSQTLYVTCSSRTLSKIARTLTDLTKSSIDINPVGDEYAIDFI